MSHGGKATGTRASLTSAKPRGSTHATRDYSPSTRRPTSRFAVSRKRCESLIRFSISLRGMSTPLREKRGLIADLALTDAGLGDKAAALALAERAIAANPIEKDGLTNPIPIEIL